ESNCSVAINRRRVTSRISGLKRSPICEGRMDWTSSVLASGTTRMPRISAWARRRAVSNPTHRLAIKKIRSANVSTPDSIKYGESKRKFEDLKPSLSESLHLQFKINRTQNE